MAKKKKPAVNPARGYATSSTPSKPKPEVQRKTIVEDPPEMNDSGLPAVGVISDTTIDLSAADGKMPYQQTPKELEEQLERDDLQLTVEKSSAKVRRDARRLDTKVRTDCRVLRNQAQRITFMPWLPEELMQQVLDLVEKESAEFSSVAKQTSLSRSMSEEDTVLKCWTLFEALQELGFPGDRIKSVLAQLLKNPPAVDSASYLWGFRESLNLLAIELEEAQLPAFDGRKERLYLETGENSAEDSDFDDPITSRPKNSSHSRAAKGFTIPNAEITPQSAAAIDADLHASDFESDIEPEDLVPRYITIKERVWKYRPDLVDVTKSNKKWKANQQKLDAPPLTPGLTKLTVKLRDIESDTLFDQWEADRQWATKRVHLVRDAVGNRPAKGLREEENGSSSESEPNGQYNGTVEPLDDSSEPNTDDENLLSGMFAVTMDAPTLETQEPGATADLSIQLRDFGKPAGISARRILEEACKSRDSRVTLKYALTPTAGCICRSTVTVYWSSHQERITMPAVSSIKIQQAKSSKGSGFTSAMNFTMMGVASPDALQSEAYISTVALFYIFSHSVKEEKVYLRLPAAWRDLYLELAEHRKEGADAEDRERVKMIRTIIRDHNEEEEDDGIVLAAAFRSRNRDSPRPGSSRNMSPSKRR